MKKAVKTIQWVLFGFCTLMSVYSMYADAPLAGTSRDEFGYTLGMALFFGIFAFGLLLNLLVIQRLAPCHKRAWLRSLLYWGLVLILSVSAMSITHSTMCSKKYIAATQTTTTSTTTTTVNSTTTTPATTTTTSASTTTLGTTSSTTITKTTTATTTSTSTTTADETLSDYAHLSADEFSLLTEFVADSFYSFHITDEQHAELQKHPAVEHCLNTLLSYADANSLQLDPAYVDAFSDNYDAITQISNFDSLQKNFIIDQIVDSVSGKTSYSLRSYAVNSDDVVEYDGVKYIDAEGYLQAGTYLYWIENNKMLRVGKVKEIVRNKKVDGTYFPYGVYVDFEDDPSTSGWHSGYNLLKINKDLGGSPIYYVRLYASDRAICKEEIDYNGNVEWKSLSRVTNPVGAKVYYGITGTKSYLFTIVSADKTSNMVCVKYTNGSIEWKLYDKIINNEYLYVKE